MRTMYLHMIFPIVILVVFMGLLTSVNGAPILSTRSSQSSELSCGPSTWETVILFYLFNYAAHALTIKSVPGEQWYDTAIWMLAALLEPFSGIYRACAAIARGPIPGETDLQSALRAGALCQIVHTPVVMDLKTRVHHERHEVSDKKAIHGQIILPDGYHFEKV